ncbi:MAG: DUF302 domain-containing protein [Gammaproteobacteria bacterium]|nr:DUF302 domain-containing protein [Gammaproteobacteria bacterium]
MRILLLSLISILFFSSSVIADNGIISIKSSHGVKATTDRLENALKSRGMTVFARINHAEGAQKIGEKLRPTELLIFGNPKVGTPMMRCGQSIAIDLPQKALIWEDKAGQVWLSYNDPKYLAKRHGIKGCGEVLKKIENALGNFARMATSP